MRKLIAITFGGLLLMGSAQGATMPPVMMNLFILTANLSEVSEAMLDRLREAGAEGFELPGTVSTPEDCRRLGAYLKRNGLPSALNVAVDRQRDPSSEDPTVRRAGIDYLISRIDCAHDLGARIMAGPFSLPWGYFPSVTGEELRKYLARKLAISRESMLEVAEYAMKKGVRLALEPLTHWEMPGLNTLREAMAFVDEVAHPNFGLTLDPSHEVLDGEGPAVFFEQIVTLRGNGKLFFVQVSAPHRGDMRTSWMPWRDMFDDIVPFWEEPISIEIMNAVPPFAQPDGCGLRLARAAFDDPYEVARGSIAITREQWQQARERLSRVKVPQHGSTTGN